MRALSWATDLGVGERLTVDKALGPAWIFPGQGAQAVGMGRDLYDNIPAARDIFDRADAALSRPLTQLIFEGPEEALTQTVNTQPAILTTSLACLVAARELHPALAAPPSFVAGHSLGEYTALVAAEALGLEDGIRLVRKRGELMQAAGDANPGTLAAILGLDEEEVEAVCRETGAEICNINSATQIVIGGSHPAVAQAMDLAKARGARRTVALKVSAAFHSSLMRSAATGMETELSQIEFQWPRTPIVANISGVAIRTPEALRDELSRQVRQAVRWQHSVEYMVAEGVRTFVEIGPGTVLTGLVKSIAQDYEPTLVNLNTLDSIHASA